MRVFTGEYWNVWFEKFFSLFISLKFLSLAAFVVFRTTDLITGGQFVTGFIGVLGVRGAIQLARLMNHKKKEKPNENN